MAEQALTLSINNDIVETVRSQPKPRGVTTWIGTNALNKSKKKTKELGVEGTYGSAVDVEIENHNGVWFLVFGKEYSCSISFCPFCGVRLPKVS